MNTGTVIANTLKAALAAVLAVIVCTLPAGPVRPAAANPSGCQELRIPVALGPGQPVNQMIAGSFCTPNSYHGPPRVDILVPGGTYNRAYWDFPTNYPQYSYLSRTVAAGRAAFAYDRLGTGASSRPLSTLVSMDAEAFVLHQIVQWLRCQLGYAIVDIVGHSFGSIIGVAESAVFNDSDALVLTGYLHAHGPASLDVTDLHPAALDTKFLGQHYDLGYMTTLPGTRTALFYDTASADPAVIAADEAGKDVVSTVMFTEGLTQLYVLAPLNLSDAVREPVLLISGQEDQIYCGLPLDCTNPAAVRANETPYFPVASSLDIALVPDTGHDLNLHPSTGTSFTLIDQWLAAH